jgi:hypothetical protein
MPDEPVTDRPLACCLAGDDYRNRIAWIEDLTRRALRGHRRDDLTLHLIYRAEVAADVRLMVEHERACCAYLTFVLRPGPGAIAVTITVPEAVRSSADVLFAPFLPGKSLFGAEIAPI